MAQLLSANGYEVRKVSIINDRGVHICKSMLAYQKLGHGETPASSGIKGDHLVGDYYVKFDKAYKEEVQQLVAQNTDEENRQERSPPSCRKCRRCYNDGSKGDPDTVALWQKMNAWVYEGFAQTYQKIGITFDQEYYESNTYLLGKRHCRRRIAEGRVFSPKKTAPSGLTYQTKGWTKKLVLRADGTFRIYHPRLRHRGVTLPGLLLRQDGVCGR